MQIIIKDPPNWYDFEPFSTTHLVCEIRCGIFRLFEKIKYRFPHAKIIFSGDQNKVSSFLKRAGITNNEPDKDDFTIELAGNILLDDNFVNYISKVGKIENYHFKQLNYLWDAIKEQPNEFANDVVLFELDSLNNVNNFNKFNNVSLINESNILIGENVTIQAGCILDATDGIIFIDDNANIMHNSVIIGPCYIGKKTIIKIASKIYQNCSFGNYCKIGGEVEDSIFHNYSNKQHDGFLGHSYVGDWVNLGAGTTTSDLKNNYSKVKMQLAHKLVDTDEQFIGTMFGDHIKTAINTSFNTGTIIGAATMIGNTNTIPKYLKPFRWLNNNVEMDYDIGKAIESMKVVMHRRNQKLTIEEETVLRTLTNN